MLDESGLRDPSGRRLAWCQEARDGRREKLPGAFLSTWIREKEREGVGVLCVAWCHVVSSVESLGGIGVSDEAGIVPWRWGAGASGRLRRAHRHLSSFLEKFFAQFLSWTGARVHQVVRADRVVTAPPPDGQCSRVRERRLMKKPARNGPA